MVSRPGTHGVNLPAKITDDSSRQNSRSGAETDLAYFDKDHREALAMGSKPSQGLEQTDMRDPTDTHALSLYATLSSWAVANAETSVIGRNIKGQNAFLL